MRIFLIICLSLFHVVSARSQEALSPTEILIIGVIHTGNRQFDHRTLYHVLGQVKPDVILWEQSEDFERVPGLLTAFQLKLAKPGIEQMALQKYAKRNPHIGIFGFDTLITSRKKYIKEANGANHAFFQSLAKAKLNAEDSTTLAGYITFDNAYVQRFFNSNLVDINKPEIYGDAGVIYALDQTSMIPMAKKYLIDTAVIQAFENDHHFWIARNDYMVKQILYYAKEHEGSRMVVLTGLNHKYYLMDKLSVQQEVPVKLLHLSYK